VVVPVVVSVLAYGQNLYAMFVNIPVTAGIAGAHALQPAPRCRGSRRHGRSMSVNVAAGLEHRIYGTLGWRNAGPFRDKVDHKRYEPEKGFFGRLPSRLIRKEAN